MALTKRSSKKAILATWLAALRGELDVKYKQGKSYLHVKGEGRTKDEFCCFGVLCDLAVKAKVIPEPVFNTDHNNYEYIYDGESGILPDSVAMWAGLRKATGEFDDGVLTSMNDSGDSFKKIARIIESKPKGLFV